MASVSPTVVADPVVATVPNPDANSETDGENDTGEKLTKQGKKKWTVGDQEKWLETWQADYLKCQANGRRYGEFWPKLLNKWFARYPEQLTDVPENATQDDRDRLRTAALQLRQQVSHLYIVIICDPYRVLATQELVSLASKSPWA